MSNVVSMEDWKLQGNKSLIEVLERQLTEALHRGDRVNSSILHTQLLDEYQKLYLGRVSH